MHISHCFLKHPTTNIGYISNTGTHPLTQFSYTAVFYLTWFFQPQNRIKILFNTVFSEKKKKKMSFVRFFFQMSISTSQPTVK